MSLGFGVVEFAGHDVAEPVCHAVWNGIDRGMRTVHADTLGSEPEESVLLWIRSGKGLDAAEDDWVVGHDDGVVVFDGLVGYGASKVDG